MFLLRRGMDYYKPIIGTLGYVMSPARDKTLLIHRNARLDDDHLGKYNGLGGKMKKEEDVLSCMSREIEEEAGIKCSEMVLRGTINWTGFGKRSENWLGFIYRIDSFEGNPLSASEEGDLEWHSIDQLQNLPMWEGDRYFLPMVFDNENHLFHGIMEYSENRFVKWNYRRI